MARKDNRGRNLKEGESQRKDGTYMYRFTDPKTKKRVCKYSKDLPGLRKIEREIQQKINDGLAVSTKIVNTTLNQYYEQYMRVLQIELRTKNNYMALWNNHIRKSIGEMKLVDIRTSHIKTLYSSLTNKGYSEGTIKVIHGILCPLFDLAMDDDIVRKNPAKGNLAGYGVKSKERQALTATEQETLMTFISSSNCYSKHKPMISFMIATAVRVGELSGLTWDDIDFKNRVINIDHQLIYKNYGNGCMFHKSTPKTDAGNRVIPMTENMHKALVEQKEQQFLLGVNHSVEVDGLKNFVFTSKNGGPLAPNAVNNILYNIVKAYNKKEAAVALTENRRPVYLPSISAHIMRHTGCTRMAEAGVDLKVLQYIMGHADIQVTMDVYNHISDIDRVRKEICKLDYMAV